MKKASLRDITKTRKWVLPAGVVALGIAAVALGQPGAHRSKAAVTEITATSSSEQSPAQSPASVAPTVKPAVTVNGTKVPTGSSGSTEISTPGGKAQVEVSEGHTRVTTDDTSKGDTSNTQSSHVDINVDSNSDSSSTSSTTTSIFSSGSNQNVDISQ